MKKLLTILVLVLGTMTMVNAQGWMFYTMDEVKTELAELESNYTIEEGITDNGNIYYVLSDDNFEWILFFSKESEIVYQSKLMSKTWDVFVWSLSELNAPNNRLIKQGDGHWILPMGSGAIDVKTYMESYSEYPVFIYSYKMY